MHRLCSRESLVKALGPGKDTSRKHVDGHPWGGGAVRRQDVRPLDAQVNKFARDSKLQCTDWIVSHCEVSRVTKGPAVKTGLTKHCKAVVSSPTSNEENKTLSTGSRQSPLQGQASSGWSRPTSLGAQEAEGAAAGGTGRPGQLLQLRGVRPT
ncbi:unnamed protein product [Rangifer tarandus platyrhynchus]|uniref:Uncharacterized protein n=1 Tax=Rangifer tarandus platyrhynchus TaxID=3082113 RepID=A0AC59YKQ2_RANTA